jgi:hypothetical protein
MTQKTPSSVTKIAVKADEARRLLGDISLSSFRRLTMLKKIRRISGNLYSVEQIREFVRKEAGLP